MKGMGGLRALASSQVERWRAHVGRRNGFWALKAHSLDRSLMLQLYQKGEGVALHQLTHSIFLFLYYYLFLNFLMIYSLVLFFSMECGCRMPLIANVPVMHGACAGTGTTDTSMYISWSTSAWGRILLDFFWPITSNYLLLCEHTRVLFVLILSWKLAFFFLVL